MFLHIRYTTLFRKLYNIFKLSYYFFFASFLYLFSQHSSNYVLFALLLLGYYFVKRSEKLLLKKSLKTKEIITLFEKKESKKERAIGIIILIVASSYLIYEYGSENIIFQNLIVLIIGLGIYEKHSKKRNIFLFADSRGIFEPKLSLLSGFHQWIEIKKLEISENKIELIVHKGKTYNCEIDIEDIEKLKTWYNT